VANTCARNTWYTKYSYPTIPNHRNCHNGTNRLPHPTVRPFTVGFFRSKYENRHAGIWRSMLLDFSTQFSNSVFRKYSLSAVRNCVYQIGSCRVPPPPWPRALQRRSRRLPIPRLIMILTILRMVFIQKIGMTCHHLRVKIWSIDFFLNIFDHIYPKKIRNMLQKLRFTCKLFR
jgi:hypothetical protein